MLLVILLPAVCVLTALFGWKMCRLASLSDEAETEAMAEWIGESGFVLEKPSERRSRPEPGRAQG